MHNIASSCQGFLGKEVYYQSLIEFLYSPHTQEPRNKG